LTDTPANAGTFLSGFVISTATLMQPTNIPGQLRQLRSRLTRIILLRGLTLWLVTLLAAFLGLGILDWTLRPESVSVRWGISILFWLIAGASLFHFLLPPLLAGSSKAPVPHGRTSPGRLGKRVARAIRFSGRRRPSLVDVALWIERTDPRWQGELAAAASFLVRGDASVADPASVQHALIERVQRRLTEEELRHLVPRRHLIRWGLAFCMVLAVFLGSAQAFPEEASLATARLIYLDPDRNWPQRTDLVLLDADFEPLPTDRPVLIEAPGPVEILVADRISPPPATVRFEVRPIGRDRRTEQLSPQRRAGPDGELQTVFVATVDPERGERLEVTAVAEDDQTRRRVTLIRQSPPALSRFQVVIQPPDYLRAPPVSDRNGGPAPHEESAPRVGSRTDPPVSEAAVLENVAGPITAVVGSHVQVQGTLSIPAAWTLRPDEGEDGDASSVEDASKTGTPSLHVVSDDGREIAVNWITPEDFEFELKLEDPRQKRLRLDLFASRASREHSGARRGRPLRSLEISVVEDDPPRVQLITPDEDLSVTPEALLPVRARAIDDFRIAVLTVLVQAGDRRFEFPLPAERLTGREATLEENLPVADWGLEPGDEATLHAVADDHNPRSDPQTSSSVRVRIVSEEEKQTELERALRQYADELADQHAQQQRIFSQFRNLFEQQAREGVIPDRSVLELRQLAYAQSAVAVQLGDPEQGLADRFRQLSRELEMNRLHDAPFAPTVKTVTKELTAVVSASLHRADESMNALDRKGSRLASTAGEPDESYDELFTAALSAQRETLSRLEAILELLNAWSTHSDLHEEWDRIVSDFHETKEETIQLGRETLSRSLDDLSTQQREALQRLEGEHRRLSDQVRRFVTQASEQASAEAGRRREPPHGPIAQELQRSQVSDLLQSAARELARNRIAQAVEFDRQVEDALERTARTPGQEEADAVTDELERIEEALRWTEQALERQRSLSTRIDRALRISNPDERSERLDPLLHQQARLADEAADWGTRLRHAGDDSLPPLMNDVANEMQRLRRQALRLQRSAIDPQTDRITTALERIRDELARAERERDAATQARRLLEVVIRAGELADEQGTLRDETVRFIQQLIVPSDKDAPSAPPSPRENDPAPDSESATRDTPPRLARPTRMQRRTLNRLVETQSELTDEVRELVEGTDSYPVVQFALELAHQEMADAARLLRQSRLADGVTDHQAEAVRQLREITATTSQMPTDSPESPPDDPADSDEAPTRHLPELVLLIRLQEQLIQREERLLETGRADEEELQRIAEQQQRLTRLIRQFFDPAPTP
jgi:hypothetical protein